MLKYFNPQSDITAYELAVILNHIGGGDQHKPLRERDIHILDEQWRAMDELQRHFSDEPMPLIGGQ